MTKVQKMTDTKLSVSVMFTASATNFGCTSTCSTTFTAL